MAGTEDNTAAADGAGSGKGLAAELSTDPDLRRIQLGEARAKRDQAEAAARKASADAAKAETDAFSAAFPKGSVKGAEGKVEVDGKVGLVSDLIAHAMARRAGEEVRNEIRGLLSKDESRVLLVSSPDLIGSDWPYAAIDTQLRQHKHELEQAKARFAYPVLEAGPEPEVGVEVQVELADLTNAAGVLPLLGPGLGAAALGAGKAVQVAASLAGGVAEIAALFRSDYEVGARDVSVGSPPLLAAVARFLVDKAEVVDVEGFSLLEDSKLIEDLAAVAALRLEVQRLAAGVKESDVAPADKRIEMAKEAQTSYRDALKAEKPPSDAHLTFLQGRMAALEAAVLAELDEVAAARADVAEAEAAVKRFDSFAEHILEPAEKGYPPLIAAAIRERLHDEEGGYTHVLYVGTEAAGGETITRRSFLRPSIRFIGGAQVTYMLWDVKARRLAAADSKPFLAAAKMRLGSGFVGGTEAIRIR